MTFLLFVLFCFLRLLVGFWATKHYIQHNSEKSDPSEVVIDEVIGQWIAVLPIGFTLTVNEFSSKELWLVWLWAFVSFRFFDIIKLGLVGWADDLGGALGVLLDDILAGIAAGLTVIVLILLI